MAASWEKDDPDQAFDDLPEPYRTINKVIDDILLGVDESIKAIESQRKSANYEYDLPQALPTTCLPMAGTVTSTFVEARAPGRLAIGTSQGEVTVIDTRSCEVVASERPPFEEGESARCIALSADAAYPSLYSSSPQMAQAWQGPPRPSPKLVVAGSVTPTIFVYSMCKNALAHGLTLKPACTIVVPAPEVSATKKAVEEVAVDPKAKKGKPAAAAPVADEPEEPAQPVVRPPPVEQLHVKGTQGGIWVIALLWDRTIRAYLCPLGEPENVVQTNKESMVDIPEEQEVEEDAKGREEFSNVVKIATPHYSISLPSMVPMQGLPEPALDRLTLSIFMPRPAGVRNKVAGQVPTLCFLTSADTNLVFAYSLRAPSLATSSASPTEGTDAEKVDALLAQKIPPMGEVKEPSEALSLAPQRRWIMPARTTAVAISPSGGTLATGGSQGTIALINTIAGPSLKTVLDGHYAAVTGLGFYKDEVLVSVGEDSWVHLYDMKSNVLMSRAMLSPPPSPPPATAVVALPFAPLGLALDAKGNMRLLNFRHGGKLARAFCRSPDAAEEETEVDDTQGIPIGLPPMEALPSRVLATCYGFCVVCDTSSSCPNAATLDAAPDATDVAAAEVAVEAAVEAPPAAKEEDVAEKVQDASWLTFFDQNLTLCSLFPGIAARVEDSDTANLAVDLFSTLTKEEMMEPPAAAPGLNTSGSQLVKSALASPSKLGSTGSMLLESSKTLNVAGAAAADAAVVRLTAANLEKMGSPLAVKAPSERRSNRGVSDAGNSRRGRPIIEIGKRQPAETTPEAVRQAIPDFWQVGVRRSLRRCLEDKNIRQATIRKHMDAMRKEVEGT